MLCGHSKSHRTWTKLWNLPVMISSIANNFIPANVCPQHTRLISSNRLCYYRSSHTILITYMFAAYHTHLVKLNHLCLFWLAANSSSKWTVCRLSQTPWSGWPFLLFWLIANSSSERTVCLLSHTPWFGWLFLFWLITNSSYDQLYATYRTHSSNLNSAWCLRHHTQFILLVTVLLRYHLRFMHCTQFGRLVSYTCVVLGPSCGNTMSSRYNQVSRFWLMALSGVSLWVQIRAFWWDRDWS